jgi:hypothetical protein
MPRYIIKIEDYYLDWSTIVDAPITFGLDLKRFNKYYEEEYGRVGMLNLPERLNRVDEKGTSSLDYESVEDLIDFNRAGPNESCLTLDEIYSAYCLKKPIRNNWLPS